jgi:acetyl-CoA synthetase
VYADPGWVTGTSMESLHPLVSGVTSIIDEAEFDAMRWYSIPKSKSNYLVYCAHGNQALNAYGGHKAKRSIQSENLRSILSVGEPLNAEAVIWGEENFDLYYGQLVANGNGGIMIANYPSM